MAQAAHIYPNFTQQMGLGAGSTTPIRLSSGTQDTLKVGLAVGAGAYVWNGTTQAHTTVANFLATGGISEVSYAGATPASRVTLTGVTYTETGLISTLTCANPSWANGTFTADYAFFYDYTAGASSDVNGVLICYWDFGGDQQVNGATFTLTINASGLATWTSS